MSVLKPLVNLQLDDWDEQCEFVCHAYNATVHASTKCTPNLLVFGEDIIMPADLVFGVVGMNQSLPCQVMFVESLRNRFREAYEMVRIELKKNAKWQKVGYDTGLKIRKFAVGDKVLRIHAPLANIKLAANWDGPFVITEVISESTVFIQSSAGRTYKSNVARLRPWKGRESATEMDGMCITDDLNTGEMPIIDKVVKRGPGRPRKDSKVKCTAKVTPKKGVKVSPGAGLKGKKGKKVTVSSSDKKAPVVRVIVKGNTNLRRSPRLLQRSAVT